MTKLEFIGAILAGAGFIYLGLTDGNDGAAIGYMAMGSVTLASAFIFWLGEQ